MGESQSLNTYILFLSNYEKELLKSNRARDHSYPKTWWIFYIEFHYAYNIQQYII